jgi:hypothetical protein
MASKTKRLSDENLKAAQRNLREKLGALASAERKVQALREQRDAASETYRLLEDGGAADSATANKMRSLEDQIELIAKRLLASEAELPRLNCDLEAVIATSIELYAEAIVPRLNALEVKVCKMLQPFYVSKERALSAAQRTDCISYLRSHSAMSFHGETDPLEFARWLVDRITHALSSDDALPWGPAKPPQLNPTRAMTVAA